MTVSTLAFAVALFGWVPLVVLLSVRLRRVERRADLHEAEIRQLWRERRSLIDNLCDANTSHQADYVVLSRNLTKTTDDLTDLRGEYLAQARALDAHDERLQALEDR